jgi:hypothetical protein
MTMDQPDATFALYPSSLPCSLSLQSPGFAAKM